MTMSVHGRSFDPPKSAEPRVDQEKYPLLRTAQDFLASLNLPESIDAGIPYVEPSGFVILFNHAEPTSWKGATLKVRYDELDMTDPNVCRQAIIDWCDQYRRAIPLKRQSFRETQMKRYLLFAGPDNRVSGGWHDFKGDFDTQLEAEEVGRNWFASSSNIDWWQAVDTETGSIVADDESAKPSEHKT